MHYHFIIGIPRSGTSLLCFIFNKNKTILALHEPKHAVKILKDQKKSGLDTLITCQEYFSNIDDYKGIKESPYTIDFQELNKVWETPKNERSVINLCYKISLAFRFLNKDNTCVETVVDKNPSYIFRINELAKAFPTSKFIIMTRDYRGFALSKIEKAHPDNLIHSFWHQARIWNFWNRHIFKAINKHGERCRLVKYEDLVLEPKQTTEEICSFLNLDFDEKMLEIENFNMEKHIEIDNFSERKKTKYQDLSKAINTNRTELWKEKLSDKEIAVLDNLCKKYGEKLGYKPYRKTSAIQILYYRLISIPSIFATLINKILIKRL